MKPAVPLVLGLTLFAAPAAAADPADLIVRRGKVVTVDARFATAEAVAVRGGRVVAVGADAEVMRHQGPATRVVEAGGKTVLPGLYDSHTHPVLVATLEAGDPVPVLGSIPEVLGYVRKRAAATPAGTWIVIRFAFPTRLKEARFPTKAELDSVAPDHPVLYHAGPAGVANSAALRTSGVTKDTPDPPAGQVVRDPATGQPTGMLPNAYGVLRGLPGGGEEVPAGKRREGVRELFRRYNRHGLTSVADRNADRAALDVYLALREAGELTVRVNVARSLDPAGTRDAVARRLDELPGADGRGGPTGVGDEWVRVGPVKLFLDGGMLNGSAYMRDPWPKGDAYQVTEDDYRGLLFVRPDGLRAAVEEAARRKWQVTAHTAGEGAMDVLLDAYEFVDRLTPIRDRRFCITHANFPSRANLERCRRLGVCADVQPAWLWKDGRALLAVLGRDRMRWFQPYRTWLEYTTVGGGSDHMIRTDPVGATNPWSPWLGMWVALTRRTEGGGPHEPAEALSRGQAVRLYTINNAYLHHEEKEKGSLEVGKRADLIMADRDVLTCPADGVRDTRVLLTVVGGKVVYEGP